jgi:fatty-acyl-CoA synthase
LQRGDRLGIWAPNCIEWILTQYATALIGVIQVNINPAYKAAELEYSLNKVGCKTLIMSDKFKSTNCIETLSYICPELANSKNGRINSDRLKMLKNVVLITDNSHP